jgi:hypothetical protein
MPTGVNHCLIGLYKTVLLLLLDFINVVEACKIIIW